MKKKENNLGQNKFILPLLLVIIALLLVVIVVLLVKDSNNKLYKDESIVDSNDNYNDTTNSDTSTNNDNSLDNSSNDENNTNKDNYIGKDKALDIVLEKEGISKNDIFDLSCELDYKYNQMVYEIDFNYKNYEYEYYLSASDGKIIHSFKERD